MKYVVASVGNKLEQSFQLKGSRILSSVLHSSRLILFVENLFCSIWRKILTRFSMQMESVPMH